MFLGVVDNIKSADNLVFLTVFAHAADQNILLAKKVSGVIYLQIYLARPIFFTLDSDPFKIFLPDAKELC